MAVLISNDCSNIISEKIWDLSERVSSGREGRSNKICWRAMVKEGIRQFHDHVLLTGDIRSHYFIPSVLVDIVHICCSLKNFPSFQCHLPWPCFHNFFYNVSGLINFFYCIPIDLTPNQLYSCSHEYSQISLKQWVPSKQAERLIFFFLVLASKVVQW